MAATVPAGPAKPMELDDHLIAIGQRIKRARARVDMSAEDLAKATAIPLSMISKYETGRHECKVTKLGMIADATGVSADFLLGRIDEATAYACLPRGWVIVDKSRVAAIRAAKTVADIEHIAQWEPLMLEWKHDVPDNFALMRPSEFAALDAELHEIIKKFDPQFRDEWDRRYAQLLKSERPSILEEIRRVFWGD